jgi:threonine aldolase
MIDLRSDTGTRPTEGMLKAMFNAKVGDDIFDDDPTVNALQEKTATLFGMEDALFCASGTMTNQIAIKVHTQPGDEIICHKYAHIYNYEGGGVMFNSGCSVKMTGDDSGLLKLDEVIPLLNPDDIHFPTTRMLEVENTANKGGGTCYDFSELEKMSAWAKENNLAYHLDGARVFNAMVAKGESPEQYGAIFDSISICLSKGLGCPVGSLILGTKDFIKQAKRVRKKFGGGWRQAGFLAAAGIYALDNHIERLAEDHAKAKRLADALQNASFVKEVIAPETNIVIFKVEDGDRIIQKFLENNISIIAMANNMLRMVTHLDVSNEQIDQTIQIIESI